MSEQHSETPSADMLRSMLNESMEKNPEKMGFTEEESKKFSKAFDDPEFRKMFGEYMDELQDPKHRAETEAYIAQLEGEQRVPEGKELIRPTQGFVAKTFKEDKNAKDGKGEKLWMNIVVSDKVAKPTSVVTKEGESWSVPYSLGPPHMEKDNTDTNVATFDCCFHPEALRIAQERRAFQNLLVQTAMEGVEEAYKRQKQPTKLLKDFHIIKGVTYKSGVVSTMMIDKSSKESWAANQTPDELRAAAAKASKSKESNVVSSSNRTEQAQDIQTSLEKKPVRTKEEVAAAVAAAKSAQQSSQNATSPANESKLPSTASATSPKKKGESIIKKGFLENRGGSSADLKPSVQSSGKNALIQELPTPPNSSTKVTTAVKSPSKSKQTQPPQPPSAQLSKSIEQEAAELASRSAAEVQAVSTAAAAVAKGPRAHAERAVDTSLLQTLNKEQASTESRPKGPIEPKYTVTERGIVEWGDFELSRGGGDPVQGRNVRNSRPKDLVVRIELPRVVAGQTGLVELDVSEKRLTLKYKDIYHVTFPLPYRVNDKQGAAKFEKTSQALVVTLPVAKPTAEELASNTQIAAAASIPVLEPAAVGEKSAIAPAVAEGTPLRRSPRTPSKDASKESVPNKEPTPSSPRAKKGGTSNPYVASISAEEAKAAADLKEEISRAATAAKLQAEQDAKDPAKAAESLRKAHEKAVAAATAAAVAQTPEGPSSTPKETFLPSETFTGRKPGYVFKRSDLGVGYHWDTAVPVAETKPASSAAPSSQPSPAVVAKVASTPEASSQVPAIIPPYECRQTTPAVSVLIGLPGINAETVQIQFTESNARCSFVAINIKYAFDLEVPVAHQTQYKLDPSKCKYDVAKKNMVLVLVKAPASAVVWETAAGASILDCKAWVPPPAAPITPKPIANATVNSTPNAAAASPIEDLIKQAQTMKFSAPSADALFDLD